MISEVDDGDDDDDFDDDGDMPANSWPKHTTVSLDEVMKRWFTFLCNL